MVLLKYVWVCSSELNQPDLCCRLARSNRVIIETSLFYVGPQNIACCPVYHTSLPYKYIARRQYCTWHMTNHIAATQNGHGMQIMDVSVPLWCQVSIYPYIYDDHEPQSLYNKKHVRTSLHVFIFENESYTFSKIKVSNYRSETLFRKFFLSKISCYTVSWKLNHSNIYVSINTCWHLKIITCAIIS